MASDLVDLSVSSTKLAADAITSAYNQSTTDMEKDKSRPRIAHLVAQNNPSIVCEARL